MSRMADCCSMQNTHMTFEQAFDFTCKYLVGGLTSPGRVRAELDGKGFFVARGDGAYLYDIEGTRYVDLNCGHGASLTGHNHPDVIVNIWLTTKWHFCIVLTQPKQCLREIKIIQDF